MKPASFVNEGYLKILGSKVKTCHEKNYSGSRFSVKALRFVSASGVNGPVIFLDKGTKVHPRLIGTNLITRNGFPEVSCVIPNKSAYMDDETWANMVKVVVLGIRIMKVSGVACVFTILFSIYLTIHLCTSKLSSDNFWFSKVVVVLHV